MSRAFSHTNVRTIVVASEGYARNISVLVALADFSLTSATNFILECTRFINHGITHPSTRHPNKEKVVIKRRLRCRGPMKHDTTSKTLALRFESAAPAATNAARKTLLPLAVVAVVLLRSLVVALLVCVPMAAAVVSSSYTFSAGNARGIDEIIWKCVICRKKKRPPCVCASRCQVLK